MGPETINDAVRAERNAVADLVAPLDGERWSTASLCAEWSVRDVVAHLTTTTRSTLGGVLVAAVRARGSFDRMGVQEVTRLVPRHSDAELVALLRESADSDRRMPMSGPMDPLMDLVIHAQDIARPLGLAHETPAEVVAACLSYVATNRWMGAPRRLQGLRVVSADDGWSLGDGPEVTGPDLDLLLAVAGRPAGLAALSGPGLSLLAERVTPVG